MIATNHEEVSASIEIKNKYDEVILLRRIAVGLLNSAKILPTFLPSSDQTDIIVARRAAVIMFHLFFQYTA